MTDKGKKPKLDEGVDADLVTEMQKLQEIQDELEKVNEEANDKVLEVEQKYNKIRKPIYQKRNTIIQEIPDFWLTAFLSHPALCEFLASEDQKVFKFLSSLDVEDFEDVKSGYSICFNFKPNPFFEDTKLTKVFRFSEDGTLSVSGTRPRWNRGMDYTNGASQEKDGNKRVFSESSFFKWFMDDTQTKDESEGIHHDEIAEIIKEDLWPNPLKYFNNDPDESDEDDDGEGEDEGDDGGEDEDEGNGGEYDEQSDEDE